MKPVTIGDFRLAAVAVKKSGLPILTKAGVLDFKNDEQAYVKYEQEVTNRALELLAKEKKP